jgi:hypothetical protein
MSTPRRPSEGWGPYGLSMDASFRWHDVSFLPEALP